MSGPFFSAIVWLTVLIAWSMPPVASANSLAFEMRAASAETYAQPHDIVLSPDGSLLYVADNEAGVEMLY